MGDPNHPYQLEAFNIFQTAWLDLQYGQHTASPPVLHDIANQAADRLAAATEAAENPGSFLYSALSAIVDHGSQSPASLDLMLQTYTQAAKQLPASVSGGYGKGMDAAMGELNWWIAEEADLFSPPLQFTQETPGQSSTCDSSNPQFQERDVKDRQADVLDRTQEWRKERVRWTLMSAAMGRCYALDLVRANEGKNATAQVDGALDIEGAGWSEAQFVGATVMLRACAKSLGVETIKVSEWVEKLEALLWREHVSFTVKSHSELLLRNLRGGPYDETSEQLFQMKDWLF
ncbi:uncharacterized protein BP5553_03046 [Venustampulla echinocandica]|uniref:Uncharacterized protein n=1 Tax=Venustampulla echinocandica TaxID=2656787 RepID=A0A370TT50_9HELO|nr:uncharacterized protein BP5553_03046 [Venustampulla echinocandica]RDL38706.1 hypothetical protein BP5553_03046 [Venustampulla echinocandica]